MVELPLDSQAWHVFARRTRVRSRPGSPAADDRANHGDALVVDVPIGMDGDNAPPVLPAGVQRAKVKEEQCGFVVAA